MQIVHCSKKECTHYCGRFSSIKRAKGSPIDLSVLSNPEPLSLESDRSNNIKRYAKYLFKLCKTNKYIIPILLSIPDDAVLGCFCFPKECHCNVIIDARNYYKNK